MRPIALATEDELSETVGLRLLSEIDAIRCDFKLRKGGSGYLRSNIEKFEKFAKRVPILLITDLDTAGASAPQGILFRVAVREIESWLLADHDGISNLLQISPAKLPDNPDILDDPKRSLLHFAKNAPREIRSDLIADKGVMAAQGMGYNFRLGQFVRESWSPQRAASRSDSLRRTRERLIQFLP